MLAAPLERHSKLLGIEPFFVILTENQVPLGFFENFLRYLNLLLSRIVFDVIFSVFLALHFALYLTLFSTLFLRYMYLIQFLTLFIKTLTEFHSNQVQNSNGG